MARLWLITGGSRSGKSAFALNTAEALSGAKTFLATCPVVDDEMDERIRRHRQERDSAVWSTVEEPVDLVGAFEAIPDGGIVLVDCLTLWVSNLLMQAHQDGQIFSEDNVAKRCWELLAACDRRTGVVLLVTNEIGDGIVPGDPVTRCYRDAVGRCNQTIAAQADEVTLVVCGLPVALKGSQGVQ